VSSAGGPWWRPDGTPLAKAPYEADFADTRSDRRALEMAYRIKAAGESGWVYTFSRPPGAEMGGSGNPKSSDPAIQGTLFAQVIFPPDEATMDFTLGVAAGAWQVIASGPVDRGLVAGTDLGAVWLTRLEQVGRNIRMGVATEGALATYGCWRVVLESKSASPIPPPA